jgi:hypothetical protein
MALVLCFGLSFGINELTRPRFEYAMGPSERVDVTGALKVEAEGGAHQVDLASIHVVVGAAPRLFGDPLPVRALWMRSAELEAQSEPDLELFADLGALQPAIDANARSLDAITGREIEVLPVALASSERSRLRLPGTPTHGSVKRGTLTLRSASPLASVQGAAAFRVSGELALTLIDGSAERNVRGAFDATVIWY